MCPCKKEILEPPDTLWFFLLLGFALAVALLFLLCQLLKHHLKGSSSNGLVYVIPEAEISKRRNPEFSDRLVGKAQAAGAVAAQFVAIGAQGKNLAGLNGDTTKSGPKSITIASQNTAPQSKQRSIQLRSLALKKSADTLRPLDANTLPIIFTEAKPETQTKAVSVNSTENESDEEPTEEEDEEEILAAGMSGPSLAIQARSLPKFVSKKQDESTQTSADPETTLNDDAPHPKIKLRSLHVGSKPKAGAPKRATDTVKARNNGSQVTDTVNVRNGQVSSVENQVQASNTITSNQAQVTNTNGDSAKNAQVAQSSLISQTEAFQKSHSEQMSSITTTEIKQGQYVNLNNASVSRLRRREYELATLLRQLRNVEDKVGQLSTELEKKDLLISHYKHGDQYILQHVSPGYRNSPISLSRDDTPHSLHNPQIKNSPLTLTTAGMSIQQRSLHGADQYEKLERVSTPVPERNVVTAETTRITDNASVTPDGKYGYSGSGSLLLSPAVTRRANGALATEITTVGHSDSQNYKESANSITNGYHDVDISATRFTPSRNSIEDFEINSELKLAEALKQLRIENELRVAQTRDEQEAAYAKRESELYRQILTLANSFQQQNNEFNSLQFKLLTLEQNLAELHGKKLSAESSLRETRSSWQEGQGQGQFSSEIKRLKDLIKVMETEKQELLGRYQHLQEAKTTLDSEIFTYQSLLEEEEQRIEQMSGFKGSRSGNSSFRIATRNGGNISGISKNVTWNELPQLTRMTSATSSKGYSIESEI